MNKLVKKMENNNETDEFKISKFRMVLKFLKLFLFSMLRFKWYVPGVNEMTVDQLNDLINSNQAPIIVDVRDRIEFYGAEGSYKQYGHIQNAKSIPIMELSAHMGELTPFKELVTVTICPGGGMSLIAAEILVKAEFKDVNSLKGGMDLWFTSGYPTTTELDVNYPYEEINQESVKGKVTTTEGNQSVEVKFTGKIQKTLDVRNVACPIPVVESRKALKKLKINQVLEILATDPGSKADIPAWVHVTGQELISVEENDPQGIRFLVKRLK